MLLDQRFWLVPLTTGDRKLRSSVEIFICDPKLKDSQLALLDTINAPKFRVHLTAPFWNLSARLSGTLSRFQNEID